MVYLGKENTFCAPKLTSRTWRKIRKYLCVYQPNIFIKQLSELQEEIPPKNETAKKLITNILRIRPGGKRLVELEDVVIVMYGSGSVRRCEFGNGKKAMQSLMEFKDPQKDAKYAMVTFNSNVRTDFDFLPPENCSKKSWQCEFSWWVDKYSSWPRQSIQSIRIRWEWPFWTGASFFGQTWGAFNFYIREYA